jgi:hypothetical protein
MSLLLLAGIQLNFMGTFNSKRRCAYCRLFPVRLYNSELWPLITYAVCIYSKNRFRTTFLEFNKTLREFSKARGDAHIVSLFRSDTNSELWPLISYAISYRTQYLFQHYFPATTGWNSMKLYGTLYTKRRCVYHRLVPVRQFNLELWPLIIIYAVCNQSDNHCPATSL